MRRGLVAITIFLACAAVAAAQQVFSTDVIRERCIEFRNVRIGPGPSDLRDCRVSESGLIGSLNGRTYHYAIYCLIPNYSSQGRCGEDSFTARYHRERGLAIFEQNRSEETVRLLFERAHEEVGIYVYKEKPRIVQNAAGPLLYVPIAVDGTGNFNESEYYLYIDGGWVPIESSTWIDDLRRKIPFGLEIWKGVWPNPETMEATAGLYRKGDGNCCPTGGKARIKLAVRSRQLVLESVVIESPPETPSESDAKPN